MSDGIQVADEPAGSRYVITLDGGEVGHLSYRPSDGGRVAFTHTEVDPGSGRRGLGSQLVAFALDDLRRQGLSVLPYCSFVRSYIERHDEYLDLVAADDRRRFGLS